MKRDGYTNPFDNFVGSHNDFPVVTKTVLEVLCYNIAKQQEAEINLV